MVRCELNYYISIIQTPTLLREVKECMLRSYDALRKPIVENLDSRTSTLCRLRSRSATNLQTRRRSCRRMCHSCGDGPYLGENPGRQGKEGPSENEDKGQATCPDPYQPLNSQKILWTLLL
jgi:hypothetical protein